MHPTRLHNTADYISFSDHVVNDLIISVLISLSIFLCSSIVYQVPDLFMDLFTHFLLIHAFINFFTETFHYILDYH